MFSCSPGGQVRPRISGGDETLACRHQLLHWDHSGWSFHVCNPLSCTEAPVRFSDGCQSRFLGRGCDEALFSEKKGFSVKRGEAIQ